MIYHYNNPNRKNSEINAEGGETKNTYDSDGRMKSFFGATLYEKSIPISPAAVQLSWQTGRTPFEHTLSDGKYFELLLTVPLEEAEKLIAQQPLRNRFNVTLYSVAELTPELDLRFSDGTDIQPQGFEH
ncbi:MAG: hypothetical protein LBC74_05335 [Planctomycetaceae bacterium]|nr:hypothetical protein [Planctomycetaceae bacterium]